MHACETRLQGVGRDVMLARTNKHHAHAMIAKRDVTSLCACAILSIVVVCVKIIRLQRRRTEEMPAPDMRTACICTARRVVATAVDGVADATLTHATRAN